MHEGLRPTRQNTKLTVTGTQEEQFADIVQKAQEEVLHKLDDKEDIQKSPPTASLDTETYSFPSDSSSIDILEADSSPGTQQIKKGPKLSLFTDPTNAIEDIYTEDEDEDINPSQIKGMCNKISTEAEVYTVKRADIEVTDDEEEDDELCQIYDDCAVVDLILATKGARSAKQELRNLIPILYQK